MPNCASQYPGRPMLARCCSGRSMLRPSFPVRALRHDDGARPGPADDPRGWRKAGRARAEHEVTVPEQLAAAGELTASQHGRSPPRERYWLVSQRELPFSFPLYFELPAPWTGAGCRDRRRLCQPKGKPFPWIAFQQRRFAPEAGMTAPFRTPPTKPLWGTGQLASRCPASAGVKAC
jgi:hypothetical protein